MKPFQFRLEKVLHLQHSRRDQLREELAMALHAMRILEDQQHELAESFAEQRRCRTDEASRAEIRVDHLLDAQRYELLMVAKQKQLDGQIEKVSEELEKRRLSLVEADREVRVLEKLKENKFEEYQRDNLRQEVKEMDEIAVRRVHRQRNDRS